MVKRTGIFGSPVLNPEQTNSFMARVFPKPYTPKLRQDQPTASQTGQRLLPTGDISADDIRIAHSDAQIGMKLVLSGVETAVVDEERKNFDVINQKRQSIRDALNNLHAHLYLLLESEDKQAKVSTQSRQVKVVKAFYKAMEENKGSPFNPDAAQGFYEWHGLPAVDDKKDDDYYPHMIDQLMEDLRAQTQGIGMPFITNFMTFIEPIAEIMKRCGVAYQLVYHTLVHVIKVMVATIINAKEMELGVEWCMFGAMVALCHDAIFTRTPIKDEKLSAELFLALTQPFRDSLEFNEDRQCFDSLVHVVLNYSTLVAIEAPNEPGADGVKRPAFQKMGMHALVHAYLCEFQEVDTYQQFRNLFELCEAIRKADINNSLKSSLERLFPRKDGARPIADALDAFDSPLLNIINQFYDRKKDTVTCQSKDDYLVVVLNKFTQGVLYMVENPSGPAAGVQNLFDAEKVCERRKKEAHPRLARLLLKTDEDLDQLTDFDAVTVAGSGIKGAPDANGTIDGEFFFALRQLYATRARTTRADTTGADRDYHPESWDWHYSLYQQIQVTFRSEPREGKLALLKDLIKVGRAQYALDLDLQKLHALINKPTPGQELAASQADNAALREALTRMQEALGASQAENSKLRDQVSSLQAENRRLSFLHGGRQWPAAAGVGDDTKASTNSLTTFGRVADGKRPQFGRRADGKKLPPLDRRMSVPDLRRRSPEKTRGADDDGDAMSKLLASQGAGKPWR